MTSSQSSDCSSISKAKVSKRLLSAEPPKVGSQISLITRKHIRYVGRIFKIDDSCVELTQGIAFTLLPNSTNSGYISQYLQHFDFVMLKESDIETIKMFLSELSDEVERCECDSSSEVEQDNDPFRVLPTELHSLVMQHFNGSDLLKMSEVSTGWYEMIDVPIHMEKVMIKCELTPRMPLIDKDEFLNIWDNSVRQFYNAKLAYDASTQSQALELLSRSADTLKSLEIGEIYGHEQAIPQQQWSELKHLNIGYVSQSVFDFIFNGQMSLETLIFNKTFKIFRFGDKIARFLSKQTKLKTLKAICDDTCPLMGFILNLVRMSRDYPMVNPMKFQLKELVLGSSGGYTYNNLEPLVSGFSTFMRTQIGSLEKLVLLGVYDRAFINLLFNEMQIKSLAFNVNRYYHNREVAPFLDLQVCRSLVELRIGKGLARNEIVEIITAAPELTLLGIEHLYKNHIDSVATLLMKLKVLEYRMIQDGAERRYESMKTEHEHINKNIQMCFCNYDIIESSI